MLYPSNFLITIEGATFKSTLECVERHKPVQCRGEVTRLGGKLAVRDLLNLKRSGTRFKSELDNFRLRIASQLRRAVLVSGYC